MLSIREVCLNRLSAVYRNLTGTIDADYVVTKVENSSQSPFGCL